MIFFGLSPKPKRKPVEKTPMGHGGIFDMIGELIWNILRFDG
jgi:hypothetical protein